MKSRCVGLLLFVLLMSLLAPACGEVKGSRDECALELDDCEEAVGLCTDTDTGFTCSCMPGFVGSGQGADSCLWDDPALTDLVLPVGATLTPAFSPDTTTYVAMLPRGTTAPAVTATVAQPAHATITVAGSIVVSGESEVVPLDFVPTIIDVVVTTDSGATRTYTIATARGTAGYVKASNTAASDFFGHSVSISADGTRLAVGANGEDSGATGINGDQTSNGALNSGAAYVFVRSGATWTQEAYIKASNTSASAEFGRSVALSMDGSRLAVGAQNEGGSGAAYVFVRSGTTWAQEAFVKASNPDINDLFGNAVAISGDGSRLAVGAFFEDSPAVGVNAGQGNGASESGAAYVFTRTGTTWAQEAYVKASNTEAADQFGVSLALSGDGLRLAVGAPSEDSIATGVNGNQVDNTANFAGAVYVFGRTGTVWTQEAYVKATNTGASDIFGDSVSLSNDGSRLAVGATGEASGSSGVGGNQADNGVPASGAAYVFLRTTTTWAPEAYFKASNPGNSDSFGFSVSLSPDGTRLGVGAQNEDSASTGLDGDQLSQGAGDSGAAYLYKRTGTTWAPQVYVKAINTGGNDLFGATVALSADEARFAVGARFESSNATGVDGDATSNAASQAGACYVY